MPRFHPIRGETNEKTTNPDPSKEAQVVSNPTRLYTTLFVEKNIRTATITNRPKPNKETILVPNPTHFPTWSNPTRSLPERDPGSDPRGDKKNNSGGYPESDPGDDPETHTGSDTEGIRKVIREVISGKWSGRWRPFTPSSGIIIFLNSFFW